MCGCVLEEFVCLRCQSRWKICETEIVGVSGGQITLVDGRVSLALWTLVIESCRWSKMLIEVLG